MKKSLKIFLILVLAVLMSLSLVACGSGNKNNSTSNSQSQDGGEEPENTYRINVGEVQNGSVSIFAGGAQKASGDIVASGVSVTIEMTANDDYVVKSLVISELSVNKTYNSKTESYNFTMPNKDVNVAVTFGAPSTNTFNVSVTKPTGGTINVDKSVALQGETVTLSNTPSMGYKFVSYSVNGKTQTANTFTMPSGNVTVTGTFAKIDYTISVTQPSAGGTISVSKTMANYGDTITLSNAPTGEYSFVSYTVNGKSQTTNTFTMPASNVTVSGTFQLKEYKVSITSAANGTVTANPTSAAAGTNVTLTINPNNGYTLASLKVNGTECSSFVKNNAYTFKMPSGNVTVTYSFAQAKNVTTSAVTNGTLTVSHTQAKYNTVVTVTATPKSGYACSGVTLKVGNTTTNLRISNNKATFTMPNQDVVVSATFRAVSTTREYVSHMLLGDSYTDTYFYQDFYADFAGLPAPKDIGMGGTVVTQWIDGLEGSFTHWEATQDVRVKDKYDVDNFIFHIGVNDIDGGVDRNTVIANLKTLFTNYHNAYPNAKIYWVSLSLNTLMPVNDATAHYTADYLYVNNTMKTYMAGESYLQYIDTCSTMFPDSQPVADWFFDGLHFNADGYDTWGALILDAIGYPKQVQGGFGKAGNYYTSGTFKANADGSVSNTTKTRGEQNLWFNGIYSQNAYAEMEVTVHSIQNKDDYPKFGMAIKTASNHVFFYVDAVGLTGKGTGVTYRAPEPLNGGLFKASAGWNWSLGIGGTAITSNYSNNNYVKLGLLKSGSELYFFADDVLVHSITLLEGVDGSAAIGLTLFNLNVTVKNYSVVTDISTVLSKVNGVANARMETSINGCSVSGNSFTNATVGGEISGWVSGLNHSKFYFESDVNITKVIGTDEYPKAGIVVNLNGTGTLLFYIDAINTGAFGTNAWVGCVYRPNGGDWNWTHAITSYVKGLQYTGSNYAKLGLYKNGSNFIFTVNGYAILEVNQYTQFAGNVNVGIMAFNLGVQAKNCGVTLSDTMLNRMKVARHMNDDINVDGNITEWGTYSAKSYSAYATDGRGYKVYAFKGTDAIYVAYEIKSNTFTNNKVAWFENTNVEIVISTGTGTEQIYASVDGQSRLVKSFAYRQSTSGSLKVTTVELAIAYKALPNSITGQETQLAMGFACRIGDEIGTGLCEGNDNVWWTGAQHAYQCKTAVGANGIV